MNQEGSFQSSHLILLFYTWKDWALWGIDGLGCGHKANAWRSLISTMIGGLGFDILVLGESHTHIRSEVLLSLFFSFPFASVSLSFIYFLIHCSVIFPFVVYFLCFFLYSPFRKKGHIFHIVHSTWMEFCFYFQCLWNGNSERTTVLCKFIQQPRYTVGLKLSFLHCQYHDLFSCNHTTFYPMSTCDLWLSLHY